MKKMLLSAVAIFLLAFSLYPPREAAAIPAFARQTGMACNTCHFQHYPSLNAFGRAFKSSGYTMVGGQSMVEGDMLSIPAVLNASLVTKIRYQKTNGDVNTKATNEGEIQFPDEAALLLGGRVGEHIGFLLEASLKDGDSNFASFKMPITYNVMETDLSVIPFTTDAAGVSYGFELLNTGAQRTSRPLEHRKDISAAQYIEPSGDGDAAATGVSFVVSRSLYFFNYTPFYADHGDSIAGPFIHYFRAAFTPTYAGWDLGIGAQYWTGTARQGASQSAAVHKHADAWAIDAQAQGMVGSYPLGVYLSYANADKSGSLTAGTKDNNIFNSESTNDDKTAWAVMAELGVVPNRLTAAIGYRGGKNGNPNGDGKDTDNATFLALAYNATQNFQIQLDQSWYSGDANDGSATGDSLTTLMIFAAF